MKFISFLVITVLSSLMGTQSFSASQDNSGAWEDDYFSNRVSVSERANSLDGADSAEGQVHTGGLSALLDEQGENELYPRDVPFRLVEDEFELWGGSKDGGASHGFTSADEPGALGLSGNKLPPDLEALCRERIASSVEEIAARFSVPSEENQGLSRGAPYAQQAASRAEKPTNSRRSAKVTQKADEEKRREKGRESERTKSKILTLKAWAKKNLQRGDSTLCTSIQKIESEYRTLYQQGERNNKLVELYEAEAKRSRDVVAEDVAGSAPQQAEASEVIPGSGTANALEERPAALLSQKRKALNVAERHKAESGKYQEKKSILQRVAEKALAEWSKTDKSLQTELALIKNSMPPKEDEKYHGFIKIIDDPNTTPEEKNRAQNRAGMARYAYRQERRLDLYNKKKDHLLPVNLVNESTSAGEISALSLSEERLAPAFGTFHHEKPPLSLLEEIEKIAAQFVVPTEGNQGLPHGEDDVQPLSSHQVEAGEVSSAAEPVRFDALVENDVAQSAEMPLIHSSEVIENPLSRPNVDNGKKAKDNKSRKKKLTTGENDDPEDDDWIPDKERKAKNPKYAEDSDTLSSEGIEEILVSDDDEDYPPKKPLGKQSGIILLILIN